MPRCKIANVEFSIMYRTNLLLVFSLLLYISTYVAGSQIDERIIGGNDVEKNGYPYQASLRVRGSHKCGGSLLNHNWILTAAHCVVKYNLTSFIIVLGSNSLIFGGLAFHATEARLHPNYVVAKRYHDIALLKLNTPVNYTAAIAPIKLPTTDVQDGCVATFTGWDSTQANGVTNFNLKAIELSAISLSRCQETFPSVSTTNLCTLSKINEGLCYGDAGSPLVLDGIQIGIGSWGSPCARGYPDVHTKVYSYVNWIRTIIGDGLDASPD